MKITFVRWFCFVATCLCSAGCFDAQVVTQLNSDGSAMTETELRIDSLMLSDKELALTASSLEEALVDGGYLHTTTYPDGDYLVTRGVRMGTLDEKAKFSCEEVCTFRYRDSSKIEKELRELIAFTASSPGGTITSRLPPGAELLSSNHHRSAVIKNRLNLYWDYRVNPQQEMLEINIKTSFKHSSR